MSGIVRRATEADIAPLVAAMRPEDKAALTALGGAEYVLRYGIKRAQRAWVGITPLGEVGVMFGFELGSILGLPYFWLAPTKHVERWPFHFLKISRRFLRAMLRMYPGIHCHCDENSVKSMRWLKWMGFSPESQITEIAHLRLRRYVLRSL